jgi:pimeloyl-ACP methyl ester carboxylesterase
MGRNRAVADRLAEHIANYRRSHPGKPVYLVGHSGGTAIAVWAAEALPPTEKLDAIILLGSSLSPGYDLSGALAATKWLVSYYSAGDAVLLGAGCTAIGTMDRQFTEAAGKVGFAMTHPRLTQLPHDGSMTAAGHDGSHFSYCGTPFVTAYLAPILQTRIPNMAATPLVALAAPSAPFLQQALEPLATASRLAAIAQARQLASRN